MARATFPRLSPSTARRAELHYSLGDYLLDAVQNSVEAGAAHIELRVEERAGRLTLTVIDNGPGMDAATLARAQDPFFTAEGKHPERRVGLGLPFLKQLAEACDGTMVIESAPGRGTTVRVDMAADHTDLPPRGELAVVFQQALCFSGTFDLVVERTRDSDGYRVSRAELVDALGEIETVGSQALVQDYFSAREAELEHTED